MHELDSLNNRFIDGLLFCKKAYLIFEKIRKSSGGIERLRLRRNNLDKKLIEEVLPIARYIQMEYSYSINIKVKWINGNQGFDAEMQFDGPKVINNNIQTKQYLEVTTAVYKNDHMSREFANKYGYVFGINGVKRNRLTKEIESTPNVQQIQKAQDDFTDIIIKRIRDKSKMIYPINTTLLVQCMLSPLFIYSEWDYIVCKVKQARIGDNFKSIVLLDSNNDYYYKIMPSLSM